VNATVIALSLLCLGNLILTVGVVRRLREHTAILDTLAGEPPEVMRPAGAVVDDFAATAGDGTPVARDLLTGQTLVGFFTPGCGPCQEKLPEFLARAGKAPGGRSLAVVVDANGGGAMAERLADVALVVVERSGGPVATAFGVRAFPAFALVGPEGRIEASGDLAAIPVVVAA
jgi:hypothetical protein